MTLAAWCCAPTSSICRRRPTSRRSRPLQTEGRDLQQRLDYVRSDEYVRSAAPDVLLWGDPNAKYVMPVEATPARRPEDADQDPLTSTGDSCIISNRGVEQRKLVGLITQRSVVRIHSPQPSLLGRSGVRTPGRFVVRAGVAQW